MSSRLHILILFAVCVCTFFLHLGANFPDIMECRNFITAREMITEGNWWNTTMNLQPRLEKPPLPTWITAFSALLYGSMDSLFVLRLPSAIIATLMVYWFYQLVQELSNKRELSLIAALVLASSLLLIQQARTNSWDIYPHAFLIGSIWQMLKAIRTKAILPVIWSILLMACSVMSKGPVGPYALWIPFILAYALGGNLNLLKENWGKILSILLIGLLLGFSWRIITAFNDSSVSEMIINKEVNSWSERHTRPFYFYLHFPLYVGIWMPVLILSFFYKAYAKKINRFGNYKFVLLWILISVFLLSVIPTKKERYLLPATIPICLMVAYMIYSFYQDILQQKLRRLDVKFIQIFSLLLFVPAIVLPIFLLIQDQIEVQPISIVGVVLLAVLGIIAMINLRNKKWIRIFYLIVISVCASTAFLLPQGLEVFYHNDDFKSLGEAASLEKVKNSPLYVMAEDADPRIVWLIGKPVGHFQADQIGRYSGPPFCLLTFNPPPLVHDKEQDPLKMEDLGTYDIFREDSDLRISLSYYQPK